MFGTFNIKEPGTFQWWTPSIFECNEEDFNLLHQNSQDFNYIFSPIFFLSH